MIQLNTSKDRTCWNCKKQAVDHMVYYETTAVQGFVCQTCLDHFTMCDRCQMEIPPEQLHYIVTALKTQDAEQVCITCIDPCLDVNVSSNVRAVY